MDPAAAHVAVLSHAHVTVPKVIRTNSGRQTFVVDQCRDSFAEAVSGGVAEAEFVPSKVGSREATYRTASGGGLVRIGKFYRLARGPWPRPATLRVEEVQPRDRLVFSKRDPGNELACLENELCVGGCEAPGADGSSLSAT